MSYTFMAPETKARREAELEKMRARFKRRHVPPPKKAQRKKAPKRPTELTFEDLAHACAVARRGSTNTLFRDAMTECEGYFRELAGEEFQPEDLTATWRRVSETKFAILDENLQMTEEGLRLAMYRIPKDLRRDLLSFRWTRRYKDGDGHQWLEFEAVG